MAGLCGRGIMPDFLLSLEQMAQAATPQDAFDVLATMGKAYGYNYIAHSHFRDIGAETIDNVPVAWTERYFAEEYFLHDPVVQHAMVEQKGFLWQSQSFVVTLDGNGRNFMDEAAQAGLESGFTVPMPFMAGAAGLFTFTGDRDVEIRQEKLNMLQMAAGHLHFLRAGAMEKKEFRLTQRQIDVLNWIADGKSYEMIGDILNISARTVQDHVQKAVDALEVSSREAALIKAYQLGLISPQITR